MQSGIVTKSRSKPRNLFKGVIPTAATFSTPPSDLANLTDGDYTNPTGIGTKTTTGSGQTIGTLTFDLGSVRKFLFGATFNCWSSTGSVYGWIEYSINGSTWYGPHGGGTSRVWIGTTESASRIYKFPTYDIQARYVRIFFTSSEAQDASVKGYEVSGYELG